MATNSEPPKPPDGRGISDSTTWEERLFKWANSVPAYADGRDIAKALAELAALSERLKVAEKQRNEMKRVWDQTSKCGACQMRYEAISGEKYQAYKIADAEERARVFGELIAERDQLKAEIERLRVREFPEVSR